MHKVQASDASTWPKGAPVFNAIASGRPAGVCAKGAWATRWRSAKSSVSRFFASSWKRAGAATVVAGTQS